MKLYAVVKQGIYRHEILGIYDAYYLAENRAIGVCKNEPDDYHSFEVLQFDLNTNSDDGLLITTISRFWGKIDIKSHVDRESLKHND